MTSAGYAAAYDAYHGAMSLRLNHTELLRYAGLFTWAMVGLPLLYSWYFPAASITVEGEVQLQPSRAGWWLTAYLAFGAIYWWVTRRLGARRASWRDYVLLFSLTVAAIAVGYFNAPGLSAILLMVLAGVLPWLLSLRVGVTWLIVAHLALIPLFSYFGFSLYEAVMQSLLYVGFSGFIFVTSLVARQQAQAREDQRRLNAELRATRALLAESSRLNERTRISRELHDLLGHHLTALSLNLEVASHLSSGKTQEHVRQSQALAKLLLTDVRDAVSHLREHGGIDLSEALRTLAEGVPALDIRLELPEQFAVDDPERANVLLRCAQEIITNAVRHAGARTLWLCFTREGGELRIRARDDGRGAGELNPGNGLRGMRERLAAYGGRVDITTAPGQGFGLDVALPLTGIEGRESGIGNWESLKAGNRESGIGNRQEPTIPGTAGVSRVRS